MERSPPCIYSVGIFRKPQTTEAQPLWSAPSYLWVLNICLKEGGDGVLYQPLWRWYQWNTYRPIGDHVVDCCGSGFRRYSSVSDGLRCPRLGLSVREVHLFHLRPLRDTHHTVRFWEWWLYLLPGVSCFYIKESPFSIPTIFMNNNCDHIGESKYGDFQNELLAKIMFFSVILAPFNL